jgi:hypothetical protein
VRGAVNFKTGQIVCSTNPDMTRRRWGKARGQRLGLPCKLTPHRRSEAIGRRDRGETFTDSARV